MDPKLIDNLLAMSDLKSKSQLKREADALQKFGVELTQLNQKQLATLSLPQPLLNAINEAKSLKSNGAIRRQAQLIGKIMRSIEHEEIIAAYNTLIAEQKAQTASFHNIEMWRERLLNEGRETLTEFINMYPHIDTQQLRMLIKNVAKNNAADARKKLFRFLRSSML